MHLVAATSPAQAVDPADAVLPLQPVVAVARTPAERPGERPPGAQTAGASAIVVGPDARALEVQYALDPVANVWVANVLDSRTGETVRTVPATRVLHQLAELEHGRVDRRA